MTSIDIFKDYGIPPRPPPSIALWAHLLRKDPLPAPPDSEIPPPPLAPLDKNGTSMRVLLHDTQGTLERFSARVDALCTSVDGARQEITTVNTLFQGEHAGLAGEMVDLVNRSQREILKAVGEPVQAARLETLSMDVDRRLEALDKRVDAIQAFNQTHSQALQTQAQALHALRDQQAAMIVALGPILPLLQAIPLHIEAARNSISDSIAKYSVASFASASDVTPLAQTHNQPGTGTATPDRSHSRSRTKRSNSTLRSDGLSSSPSSHVYKRPRIDTPEAGPALRTPRHLDIPRSKRASPNLPRRQTPIRNNPSRQGSARQALLASISRPSAATLRRQPTDTSSRRPLADIPQAGAGTHIATRDLGLTLDSDTMDQRSGPASAFPSPQSRFLGATPSAKRAPRIIRVHSTASQAASTDAPAIAAPNPGTLRSVDEKAHLLRALDTLSLPLTNGRKDGVPQAQAAHAPFPNVTHASSPHVTRFPSTSTRPAPTVPSSPTPLQANNDSRRHQFQITQNNQATPRLAPTVPSSPNPTGRQAFPPPPPLVWTRLVGPGIPPSPRLAVDDPSNFSVANVNPAASGVAVAKTDRVWIKPSTQVVRVRERRSPFREGRRFIPLADSDDEDEDEEENGMFP